MRVDSQKGTAKMTSTENTIEAGIDVQVIQNFEFVTMSGQDYIGWKREAGSLEPREAPHRGAVGEWTRARGAA